MKEFVQAFGGLVGVALIGLAVLVLILVGDWLMIKLQAKRRGAPRDPPPH